MHHTVMYTYKQSVKFVDVHMCTLHLPGNVYAKSVLIYLCTAYYMPMATLYVDVKYKYALGNVSES